MHLARDRPSEGVAALALLLEGPHLLVDSGSAVNKLGGAR